MISDSAFVSIDYVTKMMELDKTIRARFGLKEDESIYFNVDGEIDTIYASEGTLADKVELYDAINLEAIELSLSKEINLKRVKSLL